MSINRWRFLLAAAVVMALWCQRARAQSAARRKRPNILFIVSDDQGWGDLPLNWDRTEVKLPRLDALAGGGVRFSNYHASPLC